MVTSPKNHMEEYLFILKNVLLCLLIIFTMKYTGLIYWRYNQLSGGAFLLKFDWRERKMDR